MPFTMRDVFLHLRALGMIAIGACIFAYATARESQAAITWDSQELTMGGGAAGDGTQWWFDPYNWSGTGNNPGDAPPHFLPPSADGTGASSADTQINTGTGSLPGGQGVVYDPSSNDPNFANASTYNYPSGGFGPQVIGPLYISRNTTTTNVLTIKGDLTVGLNANSTAFQVGRSGSTLEQQNLGEVVQLAGTVSVPTTNLDIGQREAPTVDNTANWGNGIYDYRGGTLDVYNSTTSHGIRLSAGSSSKGTGGIGRFIMHNPAMGGYVRTYDFTVASDRTNGDGIQTGVGIVEFDFENGGTRPIQVAHNLSINNGTDSQGSPPSVRSSRLDLVLNEAPTVDQDGVPQDLGLFDVDFGGILGGAISGTGDLDGNGIFNDDRVFSNANAADPLDPSAAYYQDSIVSATFNGTQYNWKISYTGDIQWSDANSSVVQSISGTGGTDVVLIGFSSESVSIPGDFNNDGKVDAADYVLWRKTGGDSGPYQYADWRSNFGAGTSPGSGASLSVAAVPEPTTFSLLLLCGVICAMVARRER